MQQHRQLAAILFTDIVGSTAIMHKDEQMATSIHKRYMSVLKRSVADHGGEILNDYGDGSLCTFSSVTQAIRCASDMQHEFQIGLKVPLRVGLHMGEVFFEDGKVLGDSVNIASRIQSLGIVNSVLFSSEINSKLKNQPEFKTVSVGRFEFKNLDEPMEVFALANEGLTVPVKKDMPGKIREIPENSIRTKWILIVLGILFIAGSYFIFLQLFHPSGFSGEKTIAVLPFENMGSDSSEEYISDAVTQDIIQSLSQASSLKKVIGWYSVKGFKKTTKSLNEIASELGVAAIVTGSVHALGNKTRIAIEVIEADTKKVLWGMEAEYESKDIQNVHSKVSGLIVNALKAGLTPQESQELSTKDTEDPEAYKLYRKGLYLWNKGWQLHFDSAESYFNRAVDADPDYALPYTGLANCYIFSRKVSSQLEGMPIAMKYTSKALALDSTLAEALTTLGFIQSIFDYDWQKSKQTLEKAIKLNPQYPDAHLYYGNLLQYTGENTKRGIAEVKRAIELDPLNSRLNWVLGRNYFLARENSLAIEQLKKTLLLDPGYDNAKLTLALVYLKLKMYGQAFELIKQLPKPAATNHWGQAPFICYAQAVSGDTNAAKSMLDSALATSSITNFPLSYVYVALQKYDKALTYLERAYEKRELGMYWVKIDPIFDPLRNEPRFKTLLKKMHLN
jgi:adenylate cyclase